MKSGPLMIWIQNNLRPGLVTVCKTRILLRKVLSSQFFFFSQYQWNFYAAEDGCLFQLWTVLWSKPCTPKKVCCIQRQVNLQMSYGTQYQPSKVQSWFWLFSICRNKVYENQSIWVSSAEIYCKCKFAGRKAMSK